MRCCRVVGPLWAAAKHPAFAGRPLFVVQPLDAKGADAGASFVAVDHAQAGVGDKVLVLTEGTGVRQILKIGDQVPIRSLIVGIVDQVETS
ncbi:MAG: EutN/CcmL family microcompartment protein [Deltaproteobacteria bacterium]|nr:EutN/CcmL family microcompartment protein [Deltaproteobacteria bacterium]MCW5801244.1 EutN/CcmL family microcompartment protein [Deltaproteobacteria bacterium]